MNECLDQGNVGTKIQALKLLLTFATFTSISSLRKLFYSNIFVDMIDILEFSPPSSAKILIKLICAALLKVEECGLKDYTNYTLLKERFHEILLEFRDSNDPEVNEIIKQVLEEVYCEGED